MIPKALLNSILDDDFFRTCIRNKERTCRGRVTFEHCWIYAGRQIQESWAIVPLCEFHHDVLGYQDRGDLQKDLNRWFSINRATEEDLRKYPKTNWAQTKKYLNEKYGNY